MLVAGVDALRRKGQEEVRTHFEALDTQPVGNGATREHRQQQILGGAGVGGGFQDHEHSRTDVLRHRLTGRDDEAHVRVAGFVERRGHADDRRVTGCECGVVGRRPEGAADRCSFSRGVAPGDNGRQPFRGDVLHVGFAVVQRCHFAGVHVDPDHREAVFGKGHSQRQSHIAEADDRNYGVVIVDFRKKLILDRHAR